MTEENTEEVQDVEPTYDYPMFRDVEGNDDFLEGQVGAFVEDGENCGDCLKYGEHYVSKDEVNDLYDTHDYDTTVQLHTVEYEDDTDKCDVCGEEFKSVEQHKALSECGDN